MAAEANYGALDAGKKQGRFRQYRELYPTLMTIGLFALFGSAIVNGLRLTHEPNAKYWVGQAGYAVLAIPFIVIVAHIIQAYYRRPLFYAVILSWSCPLLISMFIGYLYLVPVNQIVDRLLSTDCTTFGTKLHIEQAYKAASTFYDECLAAEARIQSTTEEAVRQGMVISQCPGYQPDASGYAREWAYLESLEKDSKCAGWCFVGEGALWTHNPLNWDSCSSAAGVTMKNTVARNAARMMVNGLIGFVVAGLVIFLINEWIQRSEDPSLHW
jgi:hypothetical protein